MSSNDDSLRDRVRETWDANAAFWDQRYGEGNDFQRVLLGPSTERLLNLRPEEWVLDIACGNGAFSRRMAQLGAHVVAVDQSQVFLERARARTTENADRIEYRLLDATGESQLLSLGERRFDAAVCSMALMDMVTIDPLMSAVVRLVKPGGRFVFSVTHPCFNHGGSTKLIEEADVEGEIVTTYACKIKRYITPTTAQGLGMIGQPVPQYYFERPLSILLASCFRVGMVLDGLEEPVFGGETEPNRPFSWANYREIPPALIARLRIP